MEIKTTKKAYIKPKLRLVKWDFNESICSVISSSPCINIIQEAGGSTRVDHRGSSKAGTLDDTRWHKWPDEM